MGGCHPPCQARRRELHKAERISKLGPEWSRPKRIVITSDWHVPYHDPKAIEAFLSFAHDNPIDILILDGDILDAYSLSKFDKNPNRMATFQDEIDKAYEIIEELTSYLAPGATKVYIQGNHEDRLRQHLWRDGKPLHGLRALEFGSLTGLDKLGFDFYDYGDVYSVRYDANDRQHRPLLHVTHGKKANKYAARQNLEDYGASIAFGHTHRLSTYHRRNLSGIQGSYELGCMCDLQPEYIKGISNWQHGIGIGSVFPNNHFSLQAIPIIDGKLYYDGQVYG